jgi:rhodanese-related sulfurtransferase
MKWTAILIIVAVVAILLLFKMAGRIPTKDALGYLNKGALVIDVRSSGEFNAGHLSTAINIPLDEIDTALPRQVKDKNKVLLLHCQSGMRSGVAAKKMKGMGYTNVFNLGSFSRAKEIVGTADGE